MLGLVWEPTRVNRPNDLKRTEIKFKSISNLSTHHLSQSENRIVKTLPAVDDSYRERRTVHLLLRQLHVQELDILTEVWILVGVLYDCALDIKEALYSAQEGRKQKMRKKRLNGSFYCFTANILNKFPTNLNYVTSTFHVNSRFIHCQKLHPF